MHCSPLSVLVVYPPHVSCPRVSLSIRLTLFVWASLVMCVMRPQCPDQSGSGPASLTLSIVVPAEIVPFYLLNYWCLFNKVWDWKIFTINFRLATCQRWRISSDTPYIATARLPYISLPSFAIEYFSNNFCIFILNKYSQIYLIETIYTFMLKTAINFVRKSLMNHQNHKFWVSSFLLF